MIRTDPAGQSVQVALPGEALKVPAAQSLQTVAAEPENLPATHVGQLLWPSNGCAVPGAQSCARRTQTQNATQSQKTKTITKNQND